MRIPASSRLRRVAACFLPSLVVACMAPTIVGLVDGVVHMFSWRQALATAGYILFSSAPLLFATGFLVRAIVVLWDLPNLIEDTRDEHGAVPSLAGWTAYAVLALLSLGMGSFHLVRALVRKTNTDVVIALATPMLVLAITVVLIALSRPTVNVLVALCRRLDGLARRLAGRSVFTPRGVLLTLGLALGGVVAGLWYASIQPRLTPGQGTRALYVVGLLVLVIIGHAGWRRTMASHGRAIAVAAAVILATASVSSASLYTRYHTPYDMLEVRAHSTWGGQAVDWLFDIYALRFQLNMARSRPRPIPGATPQNVVLITVESFRAARTRPYGGVAKMPAFDAFTRGAVVFNWAFAPSNTTRHSLTAIATGLSPRRLRGRIQGEVLRLEPRHILLAERFRAAGYASAGFLSRSPQMVSNRRTDIDRGLTFRHRHRTSEALTRQALAWLTNRRGKKTPFFLWLHYRDPTDWVGKKKGNDKSRYDKNLSDFDARWAPILAELGRAPFVDNTLVVITADHGEGLGDHRSRTHGKNLYNSEIHVPLAIRGPGLKTRRIAQPIGLVDLAPTLLELAGYEPPGMPEMDGISWAPLIRGDAPPAPRIGGAYSVMLRDPKSNSSHYALIVDDYKLIQSGKKFELYNYVKDRTERRNVIQIKGKVADRLKTRLSERRALDRVSPF